MKKTRRIGVGDRKYRNHFQNISNKIQKIPKNNPVEKKPTLEHNTFILPDRYCKLGCGKLYLNHSVSGSGVIKNGFITL